MLNSPISKGGENVTCYKLQSNCSIYPPPPLLFSGWGGVGVGVGIFKPPRHPEIPKAFPNRIKINPIVKTVKNC